MLLQLKQEEKIMKTRPDKKRDFILEPKAWFEIMMKLTDGLQLLNEVGIFHNDLKEDNIVLTWRDSKLGGML